MSEQGIHLKYMPRLERPVMIIGFNGWGNAMDISKGMAVYLTKQLKGREFASLNPDVFYRFDAARPFVKIEMGKLNQLIMPGGTFFEATTDPGERDLVILVAEEPNLRWCRFRDELLAICEQMKIDTIISLGSMYDNVLHSDHMVSGVVSNDAAAKKLAEKNVNLIYYQGPSSIHSVLQEEAPKKGITCISLWCQEAIHFGILAHLGSLLSFIGEFSLETAELEKKWSILNQKIEALIESKPEIQAVVTELKKAKAKGVWRRRQATLKKDEKVINLKDFMEPD
jgi:hypothetical protein